MTDENTKLFPHHYPHDFLEPLAFGLGQSFDIGLHEYTQKIVQDVFNGGFGRMRFPPIPKGEALGGGIDRHLVPDPIANGL